MPRATTAAWLVMPPREVRMPLAPLHAVNVVGNGLGAHQNDRLFARRFDSVLGGKDHCAHGGAGRSRQAGGDHLERLAFIAGSGCSSWSSCAGFDAQDRFLPC